jgi:hypothetical protein
LSIKELLKTDCMRKAVAIVICIFVLWLILQTFIKSLQFDFINHGGRGLSFSESKEEAIERGVYICDLELISFHSADSAINFKIKAAWVEKLWKQGTWYWTTKPRDIGYRIMMNTSLTENEENKLHIIKVSATDNSESIGCVVGICTGMVRSLPSTDTLKYNLRREDNLDFSEGNIIGELVLVVKRN